MREILFRGKRLDNGKFVEGYLVKDTSFNGEPENRVYIVNHKHPSGCFGRDIYIEVDPSTVGQFTGLTDKYCKKIFEGDILREAYFPARDVIIEWDDGRFNFRKRIYPKDYGYECLCVIQDVVSHRKVIGNIHDNPELIKEE